ncbi:hypothetical protein F2Q68_00045631 [Brassica cretica]|uniref:Uncharacterized protein n=1 Tax=Brassica cretica TaxID=69181 RepID=A0A8S9LTX7_BRACR|nr:hypothetical protein F2Q68_00045631 [Brassica cretica]
MEERKESVPPEHDMNAKWDACIDLTTRRFVYSSLGGAFAGLLFFKEIPHHITYVLNRFSVQAYALRW